MWPDLRKEAWSPGGISPGEVSCLCKYATPINLAPRTGERERTPGETGKGRKERDGVGASQGTHMVPGSLSVIALCP